jgi:cephalosporin hydroxylase
MNALELLCAAAFAEGRQIDLTGCFHEVEGPYAFEPCNYYPLLAGLARTQRMSQVLDVGTRYGGSILAVYKGLSPGLETAPVLVTIDVDTIAEPFLRAYPSITMVQGDSAVPATVDQVVRRFRAPVDMIYLDAVHTREHTRASLEAYARRLHPRFAVLDDIHLNASMKELWAELGRELPRDRVFDASELTGRGYDCGFGVIWLRH